MNAGHEIKPYAAILRIRFINTIQYRAAAAAGVATQFAWGFMEVFAMAAFYRADPDAFPMAFSQTVTYIWLQQSFLALFMMWFWDGDVVSSIMSGSIAYDLARPADLYARWFCQSAGNRLARASLRCMPILLVAFFLPDPYRLLLPERISHFLLFILSGALAFCVVITLSMLIYVSLFYTMSSTGIRAICAIAVDFLSGSLIPLPFFPDKVLRVVELTPFSAMQNLPFRIYCGHITGHDALRGVLLQIFWVCVLGVLGRFAMGRALRRVVVQGG